MIWALGALLSLSAIGGSLRPVSADTLVTGTVFCDHCKDGQRSFFDLPLSGAKVGVACRDAAGDTAAYEEETTNFFGGYSVRFDGSPDLSGCTARVASGPPGCDAAAGPPQRLTLIFRMFGMGMYVVAPLLSQPDQPIGFCPQASAPPSPTLIPPSLPTPAPPLLPLARRPFPTVEASACPHEKWVMPQYRCHWRVVSPETRVALAFGPIAAGRYGMEMNLWQGLLGRGDLYRTLLREATTSLLNSYSTTTFSYPALVVVTQMNQALLGSRRDALEVALRLRRANAGSATNATCNFTPCPNS